MTDLNAARKYNQNILQKIEKLTTDDLSDGGLLKPERFAQFFKDVQAETEILERARSVPVTAPSGDLPRLGVGTRVMQGVAEGESATKQTIDQPSVPYQCEKVSIPWEVTWESVNESIGDLEEAVLSAFSRTFATDLEILASVGDEASADSFESINDGWLTLAQAAGVATYHHDDAGDGTGTAQPVNKDLFAGMRALMPERYKESQNLVFLGSNAQKEAWQEALTDRNTAAGDAMLIQGQEPTPFGHDWLTPLGWPDDVFMLTAMKNLNYVIQDDMRVKTTTKSERNVMNDISAIFNLLGKVDYTLMEPEGIVLGENVAAP